MKLIIAGSRHFDKNKVLSIIESSIDFFDLGTSLTEIVHGAAEGVDSAAIDFYETHFDGYQLLYGIRKFPADWKTHGKAAGPIRNRQMAEYADALLLIWDGKSRGSANMKKEMEKLNKPIYEIVINEIN